MAKQSKSVALTLAGGGDGDTLDHGMVGMEFEDEKPSKCGGCAAQPDLAGCNAGRVVGRDGERWRAKKLGVGAVGRLGEGDDGVSVRVGGAEDQGRERQVELPTR